tara:strand:- start:124 stop:258 length:135 start_codon:yes stop_codon:yes gene_type:complete
MSLVAVVEEINSNQAAYLVVMVDMVVVVMVLGDPLALLDQLLLE